MEEDRLLRDPLVDPLDLVAEFPREPLLFLTAPEFPLDFLPELSPDDLRLLPLLRGLTASRLRVELEPLRLRSPTLPPRERVDGT